MSDSTRFLPFAGRLLIGGIFLMSGLTKISAYAGITAAISGAGLPFASLGFCVALVVEIGLGLLLVLGYRTRAVALGLAIWCVVTAVFFHRNFADQNMMIQFLKNMMIAGGLLQIVHFGAGAVSLDHRRRARTGSDVDRYQQHASAR
ncbi:MAG: DoxX family protein [Steroidobacteraceae bacterium]